MKYKFGVVKRITLLLMTMALAVAMVACEGPVGPPGDAGPAGPTGPQGPQGDPGTSDNDPPALTTPFETVYLALLGSGKMTSGTVMLDKHITDRESPNLAFAEKTISSDAKVATGKVNKATGVLTVTAVGVGSAMITVEAFDGVNSAFSAEVPVMVVQSNIRPTTTPLVRAEVEELQTKLYMIRGEQTYTIKNRIDPGSAGAFDDAIVDWEVMIGDMGGDDDIVKVTVDASIKPNEYTIMIDPKKSGDPQSVSIKPKDKFGATSSQAWEFSVAVNSPPTLLDPLKATVLYRDGSETDPSDETFVIARHFGNVEVATDASTLDDTVCRFSTSPHQSEDTETDFVTADTIAAVTGHTGDTPADANKRDSNSDYEDLVSVLVDAEADATANAAGSAAAAGDGSFMLTISCADLDDTVSTTAKITVVDLSS